MASESIGFLYPTEIPGYADSADIQAAFRLYHYGSLAYDPENEEPGDLVNPSIAYTLNDLQTQITNLDPSGSVSKSIVDAKGDLIVGLSSDNPSKLSVGSNNFVLTADNSQTLGIKWSALPTASTTGAGVVQLNDTYTSTSTTQAPTANALKSVYDLKEDKALTINDQSGTTYTLQASDANSKLLRFTNSSAITVTVPASTFTAGQQINLTQFGGGQITVEGAVTVTVDATPSLRLRAQYSAATLVCITPTTFILYGDLASS
jgi:hypothetical protein